MQWLSNCNGADMGERVAYLTHGNMIYNFTWLTISLPSDDFRMNQESWELYDRMAAWCEVYTRGRWSRFLSDPGANFGFEEDHDATTFKLMWG